MSRGSLSCQEACRVMQDCHPKGLIFLSIAHTHDRFFFLHTFHFWMRIFDNAITSIADVRHIVMTILWRLVTLLCLVTSTLTMAYLTSYTTSTHQTRENYRFFFYLTLGRIRISIWCARKAFVSVCLRIFFSPFLLLSLKNDSELLFWVCLVNNSCQFFI